MWEHASDLVATKPKENTTVVSCEGGFITARSLPTAHFSTQRTACSLIAPLDQIPFCISAALHDLLPSSTAKCRSVLGVSRVNTLASILTAAPSATRQCGACSIMCRYEILVDRLCWFLRRYFCAVCFQPRKETDVRHPRVRAVCAFESGVGAYSGTEGESDHGRQGSGGQGEWSISSLCGCSVVLPLNLTKYFVSRIYRLGIHTLSIRWPTFLFAFL